MWAVGCIIAEMFIGKPMVPGTSTINQLEQIIGVTGRPSEEDVDAIESKFAATMLRGTKTPPQKDLTVWMSRDKVPAPEEAVDLVRKLMLFNPKKRPTIDEALKHPYMASFHTGKEPECPGILSVPIDDDCKFQVSDYRNKLYQTVCDARKDKSKRLALYFSRPTKEKPPK
jgi:mitogen-activated protein kinase 15